MNIKDSRHTTTVLIGIVILTIILFITTYYKFNSVQSLAGNNLRIYVEDGIGMVVLPDEELGYKILQDVLLAFMSVTFAVFALFTLLVLTDMRSIPKIPLITACFRFILSIAYSIIVFLIITDAYLAYIKTIELKGHKELYNNTLCEAFSREFERQELHVVKDDQTYTSIYKVPTEIVDTSEDLTFKKLIVGDTHLKFIGYDRSKRLLIYAKSEQ